MNINIGCHWDTRQKNDMESSQKRKIYFNLILHIWNFQRRKNIELNREDIIKIFDSNFLQQAVNCTKSVLMKNNVTVISLMMFYENKNIVILRVLGYVIYTIIGNFIFIYYLCLFQDKLSKYDRNLRRKLQWFVWYRDIWSIDEYYVLS